MASRSTSIFNRFLRLAGVELFLAGAWTLAIATSKNLETTTLLAGGVIAIGVACLVVPFIPRGRDLFVARMDAMLGSRAGRAGAFAVPLLISTFLFFRAPGMDVLQILGALMVCMWLIGIEVVFFFQSPREVVPEKMTPNDWAIPTLVLGYLILLIPSRVPSLLSGIPIDQPVEFITAALALPLTWLINRPFLKRKAVVVSLIALVAVKFILYGVLPQSGLGVGVFQAESAFSIKESRQGYTTWLHPPYTDVMASPYTSIRELPVEWVNDRLGYDFEQFQAWVGVSGYVRIRDEGRLVFVIKGAKSYSGNIINTQNLIVVNDYKDLTPILYKELPALKEFQIGVEALFTKFGEARLDPVLLYPDGSYKSLFGNADIWLSKEESLSREQTALFETIQNFLALLFVAGLVFSLAQGLMGLINRNRISEADIYLASTGPIIYFVASLVDKPQIPLVVIAALVFIVLVKVIDFKLHPTRPNIQSFILFAGVLFLCGYLALDMDNLRSIASLPEGQDGLEYQTFARNIFVYGDELLSQTPPRAYKVLFPYVVGSLHIGFGQSSAAQFFMNAWCAVLSAALTFGLAKRFRLSLTIALLASMSFLVILGLPSSFIYYFRFGLIEPIAVLCLMLTLFFAVNRRRPEMTLAAILTVLLRLDYLGLVLASFLLQADPATGSFSAAWASLWSWTRRNIKPMFGFVFAVILPPLLIVAAYFIFIPNYMLSASDVSQSSLLSMLDGFMRVLFGGNIDDFREKISQGSFEFLLIVLPLALGFLISMLSIFHRRAIFARIDLRLALLIPAILPAYIAVRPAAYFPRFSFPLLALDIILLGVVLQTAFLHHNEIS